LGHIVTAKYWQNVIDGGLHLTVADTGWAKAAWGKIYGQWIAGSAVFVYDYDNNLFKGSSRCNMQVWCYYFLCTSYIYRFFIKEDLTKYDFSKLNIVPLQVNH